MDKVKVQRGKDAPEFIDKEDLPNYLEMGFKVLEDDSPGIPDDLSDLEPLED